MKPNKGLGIFGRRKNKIFYTFDTLTESSKRVSLPAAYLLFHAYKENTDAYQDAEAEGTLESLLDWGYVLPSNLAAAVGDGILFASGVPRVRLASELASEPTINTANILFNPRTGRLAVYDPAVPAGILAQARLALGIPDDLWLIKTPTFLFEGLEKTAQGTFSGGALQALDYQGVYRTDAADSLALMNGRFNGTDWTNELEDGTLLGAVDNTFVGVLDATFTTLASSRVARKPRLTLPLTQPGYLYNPSRTNALFPSSGPSALTAHAQVTATTGQVDCFGGTDAVQYAFPAGVAAADPERSVYKSLTRTTSQVGVAQVILRGTQGAQVYLYLTTNGTTAGSRKPITLTGQWQQEFITNTAAATSAFIIVSTSSYTACGTGDPLPATTVTVAHVEFNAAVSAAVSPVRTTSAAVTRNGQILTYAVAGRLPTNNFAMRVITRPTAYDLAVSATPTFFQSFLNSSNYIMVYANGTSINWFKRVAATSTYISVTLPAAIQPNIVYDMLVLQTASYGMHLAVRYYGSGTWTAWTDCSAPNTTTAGQAAAVLGTNLQVGVNSYAGQMLLTEIRRLPTGLATPLAYVKTLFGV